MAERLERNRACLIPSQMREEHLARLPGGWNTFTLLLHTPCCLHLGCPAIQSTCTYLQIKRIMEIAFPLAECTAFSTNSRLPLLALVGVYTSFNDSLSEGIQHFPRTYISASCASIVAFCWDTTAGAFSLATEAAVPIVAETIWSKRAWWYHNLPPG